MNLQQAAAVFRKRFGDSIDGLLPMTELFDHVPDIVVFVKDRGSRYVAVNQTLASRCGLPDKASAIGRTATELFPPPLGEAFLEQDEQILASGDGFHDRLELHLYPGGKSGWCLTGKVPVRGKGGSVIGICGLSRDLHGYGYGQGPGHGEKDREFAAMSKAVEHVHQHYDEPLRLAQLAELAGLSVYQFDQRIRALFHLTAGQYLVKVRIDAACGMLASGSEPIAQIALGCGYSDQSAFSRQFKQAVGVSPLAYRKKMQGA